MTVADPMPVRPDRDALYDLRRIGEEWELAMRAIDHRAEAAHLDMAAGYIRRLRERPGFRAALGETSGNLATVHVLNSGEGRKL